MRYKSKLSQSQTVEELDKEVKKKGKDLHKNFSSLLNKVTSIEGNFLKK